jgi:glycosyltransferase involved in cell wall biosynthesis
MIEGPLVSVIMPAFNAEKTIESSINSVLNQNYQNFELIVINDGSSDLTMMKVLQFEDERIILIDQENSGVSNARNAGLRIMKGDYFCFLDADDMFGEFSISSRSAVLNTHSHVNFVDGHVQKMDAVMVNKLELWKPIFEGEPLTDLLSLTGRSFLGNTWMIRRNLQFEYKMKEGLSHGEDLLFYIQIAKEGGQYTFVDEIVLFYRITSLSAMSNLKGLENGYLRIIKELNVTKGITNEGLLNFRRKATSIMLKTYLRKFNLIGAIRVFINYNYKIG